MSIYLHAIDGMDELNDADELYFSSNYLGQAGVVYNTTDDFKVEQNGTPDGNVKVNTGTAFVLNDAWTVNGTETKYWAVHMDAAITNLAIDPNTSGNSRYDIICIKVDPGIDPGTYGELAGTLVVVKGTPAGSPTVPATPANHYKLAELLLPNGWSTITNSMITDKRGRAYLDLGKASISNDTWLTAQKSDGTSQNVLKLGSDNLFNLPIVDTGTNRNGWQVKKGSKSLSSSSGEVDYTGVDLGVAKFSNGIIAWGVNLGWIGGGASWSSSQGIKGAQSLRNGTTNLLVDLHIQVNASSTTTFEWWAIGY